MSAAQHDVERDEEHDVPAAQAFVARLFEEMREAERRAQEARARAMRATDRLRRMAEESRRGR